MIEYLKKEWAKLLVQVVMAFIAAIFAFQFMLKRDSKTNIATSIDKKADKEYVDQQDATIKDYVDKQNLNVVDYIKQHTDESKQSDQMMLEYIKSVNENVKILLGRQK